MGQLMRKKLLVKPRFQLTQLLWVISLVLICYTAGYFLFESAISKYLLTGPISLQNWGEIKDSLRWGFALTLLILVIGIGIEHYFLFHTIAGPLYALEKGLKRLSDGNFEGTTQIRETDQLSDVIIAFDEMKKSVQSRIEQQEKVAQILSTELNNVILNNTPENIQILREKIKKIQQQVEKKAA
ncbi:MAG: hypothetical protein ACKVQC_02695 [Elusimicrobiota bacterium]